MNVIIAFGCWLIWVKFVEYFFYYINRVLKFETNVASSSVGKFHRIHSRIR